MNLVQRALRHGGQIAPLIIPSSATNGTGLMNPSVFVDDDGDILLNLRHVNYTLYHAENTQKFPTIWGPLAYLHPENDMALRTYNYLCRLDPETLEIANWTQVDFSELNVEPIWEFTGLEDCRLVRWEHELYLVGVRRDTTPNGQGRMEYSAIDLDKDEWTAKEYKRTRIPAPGDDSSYCEKNWVPILSDPYHFVKWTNPVEIVRAEARYPSCITTKQEEARLPVADQRGGSQMVRWGNSFITITHEVNLYSNYLGQKDAVYRHRMCVWDKDYNLIGLSSPFSFMDAQIEFCAGAAVHGSDLLVSFGFHDSSSFVLRVPFEVVDDMIAEALSNVS